MRSDGVTLKEALVAVGVVLASGGILLWVWSSIWANRGEAEDAKKMRQIYVALSLYEGTNNGYPPPDLLAVRQDLVDDTNYQAQNDPFTVGSSFPIDPALPELDGKSPVRISFSYLPSWLEARRYTVQSWSQSLADVKLGILACYWYGRIDSQHPDGHGSTGPVIRINMDGSVYRLPRRSDLTRLTAEDLFVRRNP